MTEHEGSGAEVLGGRGPGAGIDEASLAPDPWPPTPEGERANELALAYRDGRSDLLPALFEELRPILLTALGRYGHGRDKRPLPSTMEARDLVQQSWIILDALARRWGPEGGDFAAYVRTAFPWELWRYVRTQSPGRRSRTVRVDQMAHDDLLERYGDRAGADGRAWDEQLILAEMLDGLDPLPRRALMLHLLEEQTFVQVAHALQLTSTGAYREYRRALDVLRLRAGLEIDGEAEPGRPAIERLIEALHEGADPDGRLPGRIWTCERAGLSEVRFARLVGQLVERGCVVGRAVRRPGRLVYATPAETLAHATRDERRAASGE